MLSVEEIKSFIENDVASYKKIFARKGQAYYDGDHDIRYSRLYYYNADGELVEDKSRANYKISHPFFTELVDQAVQYILSGEDGIIKSDIPELQTKLDEYFNENEDFMAELSEVLTGCQVKGFEYMYAYKNAENKISFMCADAIGVIEIRARETDSKTEYVIYWYVERIGKENKKIKRIQVWDKKETYYYVQADNGAILPDEEYQINPRPHILYTKEGDSSTYFESYGFIPFFRLDNNKKQFSSLKTIKDLIDDYDLMASGLTNNLIDFDMPLYVVKGFEGDSMDELIQNIKTKKLIGMEETETGAGVDVKTIDIPYEARMAKLEHDEKCIYRFGMGLNTVGLKDTNATTNIAIKAAYSLLDLKCKKIEIRLKQFLRKIIRIVLDEINEMQHTDYQMKDVYFNFCHEIMSNQQENAQIELTKAQRKQTEITTIQNIASMLDNETILQLICEQLDIDYDDIKNKLPEEDDADTSLKKAKESLTKIQTENGAEDEQTAERDTEVIS